MLRSAAWGSVAAGIASILTLPLAIYGTSLSDAYELLHAGLAVPVAAALGLLALSLARRASRRDRVHLGGRRSSVAVAGRLLGTAGVLIALSAVVALVVYGLLEYAGTRE